MTVLDKALSDHRATIKKMHHELLAKSIGSSSLVPGNSSFQTPFSDSKHFKQYGLYEGWVYSAIHALASAGAAQPVNLGRTISEEPMQDEERRTLATTKSRNIRHRKTMPPHAKKRVGDAEFETIFAHPLLDLVENPNEIQSRWQFVYTFIANINLTGIAFIVGGVTEEGWKLYCLPTSWVRIDHSKGPFSQFFIVNPRDPHNKDNQKPLTRDNVAFAMMPNPGDPLGFLSPIASQARAVEIDQYIQTSQVQFFENGIFPSVIVEIGRDPLPGVEGGLGTRPRLTGDQRTAIITAIHKTMSGVYNAGQPAIIDGLIESIERFSNTEQEMGWQKSEKTMRARILSAFGVHPFILAEEAPSSYAQAYVVQDQFCKRVNIFLDMLGNVLSNFIGGRTGERLFYWWNEAQAVDPGLNAKMIIEGRKMGDITDDEYRAELGFPPLADDEEKTKRGKIFDNPNAMRSVLEITNAVRDGKLPKEGAITMISRFLEISEEDAAKMIPDVAPVSETPASEPPRDSDDDSDEINDDADQLDQAIRAAKRILDFTPRATASLIDAASSSCE